MPYSNIVFVKLFLSLFEEDDRFLYQLNESQQLLYIKMLYMAGTTKNHITKNIKFICNKVNYHHEESCFLSDLERIKNLFPRLKESKDGYYYFNNFNELHNFIGNSKGTPKELQRIVPEKSKNKNKNKAKSVSQLDFNYLLKDNIHNLLKVFKDKESVKRHLINIGFYEVRIIEAFEKAGIK